MSGSTARPDTDLPKFGSAIAPHSPLADVVTKSQSGTKLRLASFHDRVVVVTSRCAGAIPPVMTDSPPEPRYVPATYLPRAAFSDIFPFPKRSYAEPIRGEMSFHFKPSILGNTMLRRGANCTGPATVSG